VLWFVGVASVEVGQRVIATANDVLGVHGLEATQVGSDRPGTAGSAGRGRPQAAARRAGLEFVEKLLTANLTSTDTTERDAGMVLVLHPRPGPPVLAPGDGDSETGRR
jgi:hypothetical protein